MILQKLASAIRRQDWFQVVIEVLIVIVGIYLGFQVTEWGQEREDRAQEQIYLNRLHLEVQQTLLPANARLMANQIRYNDLKSIADIIATDNNIDFLSSEQCNSLHMSGIFSSQAALLPTMSELIANGQLSILENEEIKSAISVYNVDVDGWRGLTESMQIDHMSFSTKYPDIVNLDVTMAAQKFELRAAQNVTDFNLVCNVALMKESTSFKNDLVKMAAKTSAFMVIFLEVRVNQLNKLHDLLDMELGISHSG